MRQCEFLGLRRGHFCEWLLAGFCCRYKLFYTSIQDRVSRQKFERLLVPLPLDGQWFALSCSFFSCQAAGLAQPLVLFLLISWLILISFHPSEPTIVTSLLLLSIASRPGLGASCSFLPAAWSSLALSVITSRPAQRTRYYQRSFGCCSWWTPIRGHCGRSWC